MWIVIEIIKDVALHSLTTEQLQDRVRKQREQMPRHYVQVNNVEV